MGGDLSQLDELAEQLARLDAVGAAIATDARPAVETEARATAAAGTNAYGEPWAPTKAGGAPLKGAAGAISAVVSGATEAVIVLIVRGYHVFHERGTSRVRRRPILPDDGAPPRIVDAIRASARKIVARTVGGSR